MESQYFKTKQFSAVCYSCASEENLEEEVGFFPQCSTRNDTGKKRVKDGTGRKLGVKSKKPVDNSSSDADSSED